MYILMSKIISKGKIMNEKNPEPQTPNSEPQKVALITGITGQDGSYLA